MPALMILGFEMDIGRVMVVSVLGGCSASCDDSLRQAETKKHLFASTALFAEIKTSAQAARYFICLLLR